jgi:tRNA pseudouridine38-40 synthase
MNHYQLIISYDGTDYFGWQSQPKVRTVCDVMELTFKKIFGREITVLGASRTDAGVHALGQVALLRTDIAVPVHKMIYAWNNALPADIVIRSLQPAPAYFHPFYNVYQKTYFYHFFTHRPLPIVQRYGLFCRAQIDIDKLRHALSLFQGTHNFRSFCTGDEMGQNTVRTIDYIDIEYLRRFGAYRIVVQGKSFLRHMVRRMVGAGLAIAARPDWNVDLLEKRLIVPNPNNELPTAAAKGLMLYKIAYKEGVVYER